MSADLGEAAPASWARPCRGCHSSCWSICCSCRSACGIALIWANVWPESYFRFSYAAAFAVNDVAMVFFFGLMTKEVVEATAPGGVLHPWRRALMPIFASIGVAVVPALLHVWLADRFDEPAARPGMAGDPGR